MMTQQTAVAFFHEHAGYGYTPGKETPEQGRQRGAERLAQAEADARDAGFSFQWFVDPEITSADFDDSPDPWALWCCTIRNADGKVVGSLGGIDFGRDGEPWGDPYRRVVEAELALEAL